jgi:polyisoprenoid-binding protein YceI
MKAIKVLLITVWMMIIQLNTVQAQVLSVKTSKLNIRGTSSLHDWESTADKLDIRGSAVLTNNTISDLQDVVVKIPVKAIKSTKGKMMDNKTWEAFNVEKNPFITFTLTGKKLNQAKSALEVSGTLTMAGVTRPIELNLAYVILPDGELQIKGSKKLVMSDFRMEPPTAMMGTIKVGDEVEVVFEMVLNANNTL